MSREPLARGIVPSVFALLAIACAGTPDSSTSSGTQAIVGGQLAGESAWSNVVKLNNDCSGLLVSSDYLITAAHCGAPSVALTGADPDHEPERSLQVGRCTAAPDGGIGSGRDLMVCHFEPALPSAPRVPIALGCEHEQIQVKTPVVLVGFGEQSIAERATGPKRVVDAAIEGILLSHEFRIGTESAGSCYGDSGSPAFMRLDSGGGRPSWRVIGILSSGYTGQCGQGFYSDLTRLVPWLEQQTGEDLSPCFNDDQVWLPTAECTDAALDENGEPIASGTPIASCGAAYTGEPPSSAQTSKPSGGCSFDNSGPSGATSAVVALLGLAAAVTRRRRHVSVIRRGLRALKIGDEHVATSQLGRVEALTPELAERAGELLASTGGSNAVDATVVASAALRGDLVVTGDEHDLGELAEFVSGVTIERLR